MKIINLSAESLGKLHSWIPQGLDETSQIIFFPDACPGKSPLPTGCAVKTYQEDWRQFAISDCGCGMRLLKSTKSLNFFNRQSWNNISENIKRNKGKLGDLGGGNHFLDALKSYGDDFIYFLIHTGSREESGLVDNLIETPLIFNKEFDRIVSWAYNNRSAIQKEIEKDFGKLEIILDSAHNTFEQLADNSVVIRKGAIKLLEGQLAVIPSHMSGDVALVKGKNKINDILQSMSHGTGRKMSRSDCKEISNSFDFQLLRNKIIIPDGVNDSSLRTEGPFAYRDLDECLSLIKDYIEEVGRFGVIAYMGHL